MTAEFVCKMIALTDVCRLVCMFVYVCRTISGSHLIMQTWIEPTETGALHFSAPYGHECMSYCKHTHMHTHTFAVFHSSLIVVCFCCMLDLHSQVMVVQNARYVILSYSTSRLLKTWPCLDMNGLMMLCFALFVIVMHLIIFLM